jgi:O-acetyl-ADP-ribose deacetylase (regulator of RNase III)
MIKWISGDILQATSEYVAQGVAVGSQEGLGTGLALKISSKWPDAQKQFKRFTRNNRFEGGDLFSVPPDDNRAGVIYIATQPDMYHATVPFLNKGLSNLAAYCLKNHVKSVSIPKIGAGLGKLNWEAEVKPLIVRHLESSDTMLFVYEEFRNEFEK